MLLSEAANLLRDKFGAKVYMDCADMQINYAEFLDGKPGNYRNDVLYFGLLQQPENHILPSCCVLIELPTVPTAGGFTAYVEAEAIFSAFNLIHREMERSGENLYEQLRRVADREKNLNSVINEAASRLGNPLVLIDEEFRVVGYSTGVPMTDEIWKRNIELGHCDYEFISKVQQLVALQKATLTVHPNEVTCAASPYRKFCSNVFLKSVFYGYVIMIEDKVHVTPRLSEIMETVSRVISYTISAYAAYLYQSRGRYERMIYNLIIGTPAERMKDEVEGLKLPQQMVVCVAAPKKYLGIQYLQTELRNQIFRLYPKVHTIVHDGGIVILYDAADYDEAGHGGFVNERKLAEDESLRLGYSNRFTNVENLRMYYKQACAALSLSARFAEEEPVCVYSQWQTLDLLEEAGKHIPLGRYCHPVLHLMRRYDRENDSDFYTTLQVYLNSACSIKLSAEKLFIHRNTMIYRLEKIRELWELDLTDNDVVVSLQISYLIDKILGYND